jgi:hypothetical protein
MNSSVNLTGQYRAGNPIMEVKAGSPAEVSGIRYMSTTAGQKSFRQKVTLLVGPFDCHMSRSDKMLSGAFGS